MAINSDYAQQMALQLASYDVQAQQTSLTRRENQYNAQVKALNSLKSALSTFSTAVRGLSSGAGTEKTVLANKATFSEEGYATATVGSSAMEGSYTFTVEQLAKKHQVALGGLDEAKFAEGGNLTITQPATAVGDAARTFNVDLSGVTTLAELASAINSNADNEGVQATLVRSGESVNLVLTSKETGSNQAISFDFAGAAAASNLTTTTLSNAQNAKVRLGGESGAGSISLENQSNTFDNVIDGVTLTFSKAHATGESLTLDIAKDQSATKGKVENFVSAYNTLMSTMKSLSATGINGETRGALAGDSSISSIKSLINNTLRKNFDGVNLINFGVRATSTGTLSLDAATFEKALAADPAGLDKLFTGKGNLIDSMTDSLKLYTTAAGGVLTERVSSLNERLKSVDKDFEKLQAKYDSAYTRYLKQYTNMMQIMSSMEQTSGLFASTMTE